MRPARRPVARHESRPAFHQPADPGDGAVHRAADRRRASPTRRCRSRNIRKWCRRPWWSPRNIRAPRRRPFPTPSQLRSSSRSTASRTCCISTARRPRTASSPSPSPSSSAPISTRPRCWSRTASRSRSRNCRRRCSATASSTRKNSPDILMVVFMLSPDDTLRPALHLATTRCCRSATSCCGSTASATSRFSARAIIRCGCGSIPTRSPISA